MALLTTLALLASSFVTGVCVNVVDADTVDVMLDGSGGRVVRVRLLGIDAPERGEPGHVEGKIYLAGRILGKRITLESEYRNFGTDRYRRVLVYIWLKDELVNQTLINDNYCVLLQNYPARRIN
jgi:endonuclease YncB( thermonuclease family)